jgi:hypothetical protein
MAEGLHELFIDVRVKSGDALFPAHAQLASSEVEFVEHSTLSPC